MQNTTYKKTRAIGWDSIPIDPIPMDPRCDYTSLVHAYGLIDRNQLAGGEDLKRFNFSFCALMNSR